MKIGTKQEVQEYLKTAKDGTYKLCLHRYRRSISQNSYLHCIFQIMEQEGNTGHTAEELKEFMKAKFLRTYSEKLRGTYIKPTKELDSKQMTEFIDNIRLWCSETLELEIPSPDDRRMIDYYNNQM